MELINYVLGFIAIVALIWAFVERRDKQYYIDDNTCLTDSVTTARDRELVAINKVSELERKNKELQERYNHDINNLNREKDETIFRLETIQDNLKRSDKAVTDLQISLFAQGNTISTYQKEINRLTNANGTLSKAMELMKKDANATNELRAINKNLLEEHNEINAANEQLITVQEELIISLKEELLTYTSPSKPKKSKTDTFIEKNKTKF